MFFGVGGQQTFKASFRAMPVAFLDKPQAEYGDKVFLPPSALQRLGACGVQRASMSSLTAAAA